MGCQYDIRHATVEGPDTWNRSLDLLHYHIKTFNIKDFEWQKNNDKWEAKSVPLGQGMVDIKGYLAAMKQYGFGGPISMHYEYPLGGAEDGAKKISIAPEEFSEAVRRDLDLFKGMAKDAGLY
jgi:sugar phosphate isomerase/epimerase